MTYQLQHKIYQRRFRSPVETARGIWTVREGIVLRLEDADGRIGFGEIAPIEDFGTESLTDALKFLDALGNHWDGSIPHELPCCAFALTSAEAWIRGNFEIKPMTLETAFLLPAGKQALAVQEEMLLAGFRTFKWKMGIGNSASEMATAKKLAVNGKLRLDANGCLDLTETEAWLEYIETLTEVEYLEQPLSRGRWRECLPLFERFSTPIALDEDANQAKDWPGVLIIKPCLLGDVQSSVRILNTAKVVASSALETSIGKEAALRLAIGTEPAIGFGVKELFPEDGLDLHDTGPQIAVGRIGLREMLEIWKRI